MSGRQKSHWLNWFVTLVSVGALGLRAPHCTFVSSTNKSCVKSLRVAVAFLLAPPCYTTADRPLLMGGVNYIQLNDLFGVRLTDNPNIRSVHPWSRLVLEKRCYYVAWAQTRRSSLIFHNSRWSWVRRLLSVASVISFLLTWSWEPSDSFNGSALVCNITSLQADFQSCADASGCLKQGNQSRLISRDGNCDL